MSIRTACRVGSLLAALCAAEPAVGQVAAPQGANAPDESGFAIEEVSLPELQQALGAGSVSSKELVRAYLDRIAAIDKAGPTINSVLAINPDAVTQAAERDAERLRGDSRGPLHGIPILIKDNIESRDPLPTTAGSLALAENFTGRDAPLVARLRAAGAVILGKTNLSEWANIRSTRSTSGWSAVGGLTRNPYVLDRSACGSSSGSGAASAASLAGAAIGTETDGSVTCPAAANGLVGLKPTVGLVSRTGIVPISQSQDTAGPMTRTVRGAAMLLDAMAGSDPADPATKDADAHKTGYADALSADALQGARIGVLRFALGRDPTNIALFEAALEALREAGAILVDIEEMEGRDAIREAEHIVLMTELKADLNRYLATAAPAVTTRTLADVIAFNKENAATEMRWFGQESFEEAEATEGLEAPEYLKAREEGQRLAGPGGIDRMMRENDVAALVAPTTGPAWTIDLVNGDHYGGGGAGNLAAVSGYPHLTVPMGQVAGLPVGLSFIGSAWSEASLLSFAYAYEQRSQKRTAPKFLRAIAE